MYEDLVTNANRWVSPNQQDGGTLIDVLSTGYGARTQHAMVSL
jgi:hypothetical protein